MPTINFKKGRVKEKVNPKVLSALSKAFGYKVDGVDDLDYEEYHNELREAVIRGKNSLSDSEMAILMNERKRIKGADKAGSHFSEKKTTMSAADMKKGSSLAFAESSALAVYGNGVGQSPDSSEDAVEDIDDKLDDILETLREEGKLEKDQAAAEKKKAEQEKRAKKEKNLERWKALKSTASKVVKPFRSIWDKIFGFLKTILLGKIVVDIVKWMGDKENQDKVKSIFRFLKDWWPVLLTAYLVFGNGLSKFIIGLGAKLVMWGATLLKTVIPALFKAIAAMGPWGWAALGVGAAAGTALYLGNKNKNKEADDGSETTMSTSDTFSHEGSEELRNMMDNKGDQPAGFNKGGHVPGRGNTDTVPAMLTPGEFVMSKGAVQKYGANTLASMNAMGGGTNRPTLMGRYNEGGKVQTMSEKLGHTRGTVTDPKEKKAQEDYMLHWVNKERTEFLGLPPLDKITYAEGVELTKAMGPGPKTTETSDTHFDFDNMTKSTWKTKSRGSETIFQGASEMLTEEDKQAYLDSNPQARMVLELKDQMELDMLGADISASAKMNGGGLVQGFQGGGGVELIGPVGGWGKGKAGSKKFSGDQLKGLLDSQKGIGTTSARKKPPVINIARKAVKVPKIDPPIIGKRNPLITTSNINKKVKDNQQDQGGGSKIPNFNAEKYISKLKIETLGMTV